MGVLGIVSAIVRSVRRVFKIRGFVNGRWPARRRKDMFAVGGLKEESKSKSFEFMAGCWESLSRRNGFS